uniref:tRNA (adenine(58)-N(1))-methyltransferase non-catalytic subunit TRM6 n=1 Tax=Ciona savignyi TaxID=51511 RepID=H2YBX2_CIOSA
GMASDANFISLNKTVILDKNGILKAVKLIPNKMIVFEKLRFKPDKAEGMNFGTIFKGGYITTDVDSLDTHADDAQGKDNRLSLIDTHGKSQSIKRENIIEMKDEGFTGEEIVQRLVENSASFADKTAFSQNKYLKKKKKKYLSYVRVHKPNARLITQLYQEREPAKICNIRIDTISQILTAANIRHGANVAVVETCSGVVLGAVLERLGGNGCVVNLHNGEAPPNLFAVSHFNFPDSYWDDNLHSVPLHKLGPLLAKRSFEDEFPDEQTSKRKTSEISEVTMDIGDAVDRQSNNCDATKEENKTHGKRKFTDEEKLAVRLERRKNRLAHQKRGWDILEGRKLDTFIVACKFHPTPIVLCLLELLQLSRPFVVYSEYKEPLMELFVRLSVSGVAINLQLCDTFIRQYQVLPERTHPQVMMSSGGGFLLTGLKV